MMIDYNALLIDMLQEKIQRLEQAKDAQRKEINRLKKELREAKKGVQTNEESDRSCIAFVPVWVGIRRV